MAHFNNIASFSELRSQYKSLALKNHPDKGGSESIMKEINAEYDKLYALWYNRLPQASRPAQETGEASRRHFYTAYGWEGSRYSSRLSTKDIAAKVREYCKEVWSQWKFSVRCHYFSGGSEINIYLKGGPVANPLTVEQFSVQYHGCRRSDDRVVPEVAVVIEDVMTYLMSYNYDDSDAMIDYFDTNFYSMLVVESIEYGWQEIHKPARIKGAKAKSEKGEVVVSAKTDENSESPSAPLQGVEVISYSEKAVAVIGNTKPIKSVLSELGGKFCGSLTVNEEKVAGWVFSKKRYEVNDLQFALAKGVHSANL